MSGPQIAAATSATLVGAIILLTVAFLITKFCRKKKLQKNDASILPVKTSSSDGTPPNFSSKSEGSATEAEPIERFLDEVLRDRPVRFTPQQLIAFTENYSVKLGSGGFGEVYKGQFPGGMHIAVKVLKAGMDKRAEEQFVAEVGTIGRTCHINLVRLYGFCFDKALKALLYEFMENGSLDHYIFDEQNRLEWPKLHEIAIGTAKGIQYLHDDCHQKIVHYDIKPANVLLSRDLIPKVADFGLAKLCERDSDSYNNMTLNAARGTPGYAAPELWKPFPVTHKCDVYSFGMLLFEILGRRKNLDPKQSESKEWFPRWVWEKIEKGDMESILSLSGISEEDRERGERMCKVALWCVQYEAEARPSMSSVVRMLEGEVEIDPPLNPFLYLTQSEVLVNSDQWTGTATNDLTWTGTATNDLTSKGTSKDQR
ncbi:rust resistance kinase Lr10-like [Ananas comosus]|uniref:Rust resistance kinase Lr10-like n=1 Tax=Ananas comosus TaxID=4615 RepID=A0A6P5EIC6_ANACO|nr:rust resistance kinase Lr10-like [Ananas comosus]